MALGEVIIGATAIIGSILFYTVVRGFPGGAIVDSVGPGLWPTISLIGLASMGTMLLMNALPRLKVKEERSQEDWARAIGLFLIFACSLILMSIVGFILAAPLLIAATAWYLGLRQVRTLVRFSLGFSIALEGFFLYVLYIPLPKGIGPFLMFSNLFF